MYSLMELSGQEYVDRYAASVKQAETNGAVRPPVEPVELRAS
jgi:hypothetical protein